MDYKVSTVALAVVCILLAGYMLVGNKANTVYVNQTVYPVEGLQVMYLYPLRCVNCDLNVAGQCDYCTSYYDIRLMDMLSQEVGVPVTFYVSDTVSKPSILVSKDNKLTLGDARTKENIANTICRFAKVNKSCELFRSHYEGTSSCLKGYGVGDGTVIYHTSSSNCPICAKTDKFVEELSQLSYNDTLKYSVHSVDHSNKDQVKLITDCMQAFNSIDYAPQLLCPVNGKDLTGEFTLGQARDFADKCIESV